VNHRDERDPVEPLSRLVGRWAWHRIRSLLLLIELLGLIAGPRSHARLVIAWLLLGIKARWNVFPGLTMRVPVPFAGGYRQAVVGDRSELEVLREVFSYEEYRLPPLGEVNLILDLGSNVGLSVIWFRDRYPTAEIIAVEPNPDAFARLCANTGRLPNIRLLNAAVAPESGPVTLFAGKGTWVSSLVPDDTSPERFVVDAVTLDDLVGRVDGRTVDVLKVDIEGAEGPVLTAASSLRQVRTIMVEYHSAPAEAPVWEFMDRLDGFKLERMSGASDGNSLLVMVRE
jgi:FkbM family methyltransferase